MVLQRVLSGEVFTARLPKRGPGAKDEPPGLVGAVQVLDTPAEEDHSDVLATAVGRIRERAIRDRQRFKPYVPSKDRSPATPEDKEEVARWLQVAVDRFRERKFDEAIEPVLKAISLDDEDRRAWILLAEAYLRVGRPHKAAIGYLRVLELNATDDRAWLGLARVLRAFDDLATARAVIERALRINPEHADSWAERGQVLEALGEGPEASLSYARALEIRPEHPVALARLEQLETQPMERPEAPPRAPRASARDGIETSLPAPDSPDTIPERILREMDEVLGPSEDVGPAPEAEEPTGKADAQMVRVRTYVEGLDDILEGGLPRGHVVLIEGAPGTMKSSFAFTVLLHNASKAGLHCLYLSLEERASSLLKQMGSLGLKLDVPQGSLVVLDPRTASGLLGERRDWIDGLRRGVESIREQRGLDLVAIDSLEALEVLAKFTDRRRELYRLFEWLRDLDVTSLLVTERPDWIVAGHVLQGRWDEDFLADGVFHLRMHFVSDLEVQRRLRVVKMRGTKHEAGYLALVLDDGGFRVTRAMSP